jgi:hypothetical protein
MNHKTDDDGSPVTRCPYHTETSFDINKFPKAARWVADEIIGQEADAIVACGHSGLIMAGAVSLLTGIPVFAVRKPGEENVASSGLVSGIAPHGSAKRWVWLDDLISEGSTFRRSAQIVYAEGLVKDILPTAVILYNTQREPKATVGGDVWEDWFLAPCRWTHHLQHKINTLRGTEIPMITRLF